MTIARRPDTTELFNSTRRCVMSYQQLIVAKEPYEVTEQAHRSRHGQDLLPKHRRPWLPMLAGGSDVVQGYEDGGFAGYRVRSALVITADPSVRRPATSRLRAPAPRSRGTPQGSPSAPGSSPLQP